MVKSRSFSVTLITELKPSERRALAFLECAEEKNNIDARQVFRSLSKEKERLLRTRFDHWIDNLTNDNYFHGWPNLPGYKECFVFKWKEKRLCHRLYGFLCNPMPSTNPRFQVCVLVSHATKTTWETNPSELDRVNELRLEEFVIGAVKEAFPERYGGRK